MDNNQLRFVPCDAGCGMSIWTRTPNGKDCRIDLGRSATFSPVKYFPKHNLNHSVDFLTHRHTPPGSGVYAKYLSGHGRQYKNLTGKFLSSCFIEEVACTCSRMEEWCRDNMKTASGGIAARASGLAFRINELKSVFARFPLNGGPALSALVL